MLNVDEIIDDIKNQSNQFEIDLAPLLALMVTLIPILLLSVTFVRVVMIETPLPVVVAEAAKRAEKKLQKQVDIKLFIADDKKMELQAFENQKISWKKEIVSQENILDVDRLRESVLALKAKYPYKFSLKINPSSKIKYKEIMEVMDTLRAEVSKDKAFSFVDPKTKESIVSASVFPNVSFGNVIEE